MCIPKPDAVDKAADELLCEILTSAGYGAAVEHFNSVTKWYS